MLFRSDAAEATLRDTADPLERTRRFILAHIQCVLQDQDLHATALAEMGNLSAQRLKRIVSLRDGYEDRLRSVLREAQAAGVVRGDVESKYLALGLLGLMNRVEMWFRRGGALSAQQLGELFADVFLAGAGCSRA